MSRKAIVLVADGSEEMETVISIDVLRRAGIDVTVAGVNGSGPVRCSRNVVITPDAGVDDVDGNVDVIVLPGGLKGAETFAQSDKVKDLLKGQESGGRLIAAICAAPIALKSHQICLNHKLTSHPSKANEMMDGGKYKYLKEKVVIDGHLITSQGPGTTFDFALAIVEHLCGKPKRDEIIPPMIYNLVSDL